jgi:hypothetical protein
MCKRKMSRYSWLVGFSLFVALSPSLIAQTAATGALTGTVTDPTGAVVPNVTVTVTNADTGQARAVTTDAAGTFKVGLLPPGSYQVKFEASGFATIEVPSVAITVTETNVLDRRLQVGTQAQEVTVKGGDVENVQTSNATVGTVMTATTVTDLPLTTRNYTNLLGLSAGANVAVYNAAGLGKGTQDISVNGGATTQNNFQMDGVSINISSGSGSAVDQGGNPGIGIANPDAIQEFKIQTSLFDAGYGRKPGANVNVVTKSGSNQFHGTAFEFFRNTDLNANDFFRKISPPLNGVPNDGRQVLNQNQYGGVLGGPVKKDKLFFFASYQETWQKNGVSAAGYSAPTLVGIPTGDRSNTAAFRTALGGVFCPTGTSGGSTSNGGVQVACNGSNINPVAINLLELKNPDGSYYIPSSSTGKNQASTFSIPALYHEHQALGNTDYLINSKNTLSTRWFYMDEPIIFPFNCSVNSATATVPGACLPDTTGMAQYSTQDAVMRLTTLVTNNLVNEARVSLQRSATNTADPVPFTNTQVGIAPVVPGVNQLDNIVISGLFTFGTNQVLSDVKWATAWELADQISWNHGKHTIRAGFEYERDRINWGDPGDSIGTLTFQSFQDFLLGLPGCAPGTLGVSCSAANPGGTNGTATSNISNTGTFASAAEPGGLRVAFREPAANSFVQDDIKVNSRFTLNLGSRWEFNGLIHERNGFLTNVWPSLIETMPIPGSTPATGTLAGFVVPSNYNPAISPAPPVAGLFQSNHTIGTKNSEPIDNFAPRLGFAWRPLQSDRFVVRGGFGFFYDRLTDSNYPTSYVIDPPLSDLVSQSGSANYFSTLAQPYAPISPGWQPRWVNFATGSSSNLPDYIQAENYLTPLIYQENLNIQYEFLPTWVLELGYVGSRGTHLAVSNTQEINEAQLVGNPLGTNTIDAPAIDAGLVTTNTVANASLRVPYLGFAPGGLTSNATDGDDKYNSLQATVRKQLSHGLQFQAAYTWGKSLTTGSINVNDPNNFRQQYGLNPAYRQQRLATNYTWDLPFGRPEGLMGRLVSGWNLSGVTIVQDGTPITITDTRGGTIFGFGPGSPVTSRAQFAAGMGPANVPTPGGVQARLGGSVLGGPGYFNKAAFATTPVIGNGTGYGNSGNGIILGPGQFNWDMALVKTTRVGGLREDATLQFRTEFFNAFNHPQFNNPAVVDVSKSTFGQITSASVSPRLLQFALKYAF